MVSLKMGLVMREKFLLLIRNPMVLLSINKTHPLLNFHQGLLVVESLHLTYLRLFNLLDRLRLKVSPFLLLNRAIGKST